MCACVIEHNVFQYMLNEQLRKRADTSRTKSKLRYESWFGNTFTIWCWEMELTEQIQWCWGKNTKQNKSEQRCKWNKKKKNLQWMLYYFRKYSTLSLSCNILCTNHAYQATLTKLACMPILLSITILYEEKAKYVHLVEPCVTTWTKIWWRTHEQFVFNKLQI